MKKQLRIVYFCEYCNAHHITQRAAIKHETACKTEHTKAKRITPEKILSAVCVATGISEAEIKSVSKKAPIVTARQIYFYCNGLVGNTQDSSSGLINRDHSTAVYSAKKISNELKINGSGEYYEKLRAIINQILTKLKIDHEIY